MSVTDGTSSRLLEALSASPAEGCAAAVPVADGGTAGRPFDRLKQLAATLLRAPCVVVLVDGESDDDDADTTPVEIQAFARLARGRGTGGTFVADAASQSWSADARLLAGLGAVACAAVPLVLADGSTGGCLCIRCGDAREWTLDEQEVLRALAGEIASRVELRRAQRAERRRASEALGRMQLLDTILATSADHLFVFDRSCRYTYVSRGGAQSMGLTPAAMMGRTLAELGFGGETAEALEQQIRSVLLTGGSMTREARVEAPGGARNFEHVFSPVFGASGRVDAVVATVRDITGRKAIEDHLKEAKTSAERAAVVKDQFLAALSHELRTPLTPVLATVSALSSDGSLPDHLRGAVGMIRRNVELQTRLIDDLLDLTRVARGKITLKVDAVDLHVAVREAAEMCQADADAKGVRLVLPPDAARPSYVRADGARVRQVLWNLIKNGVKFTPADGEVTVTIFPEEDGRVGLSVKDTGVGIPAHLIERIFLPFEQGDPQMSRRFGGLGLGLAISKALVDLHGGELSARSAGLNRGATFMLTLPASPAPAPPPPMTPDAPPVTTGDAPADAVGAALPVRRQLRILLVDDHEDTRYVLRRLLVEHDVRTAGCVSEALEEAALYDFDLLISDIGLPDGSGLDLMQQLRTRYRMKGIALSGYGMDDDVRRSLGAGFCAHLTKPVSSEAFQGAIANAMQDGAGTEPPLQ